MMRIDVANTKYNMVGMSIVCSCSKKDFNKSTNANKNNAREGQHTVNSIENCWTYAHL